MNTRGHLLAFRTYSFFLDRHCFESEILRLRKIALVGRDIAEQFQGVSHIRMIWAQSLCADGQRLLQEVLRLVKQA